jgi:hypothetical protein
MNRPGAAAMPPLHAFNIFIRISAMTNTNCLTGMQCPKCNSLEPFKIEVKTRMKVFDSGTDDHGDTEWDADSYCECCECSHCGTVADFSKESPTPLSQEPAEPPMNKGFIVVQVKGGLVQDVTGVPEGYELRVEDYDEGDTSHPSWNAEKDCFVTVFDGGAT